MHEDRLTIPIPPSGICQCGHGSAYHYGDDLREPARCHFVSASPNLMVGWKTCACYTFRAMTTSITAPDTANNGRKDDHDKPRWDLLPFTALGEVVGVLTHGAKRYGDENWRQVTNARRRYFAAACRHLFAWWRGEKIDPDNKFSHLAHVVCCILFLMEGNDAK